MFVLSTDIHIYYLIYLRAKIPFLLFYLLFNNFNLILLFNHFHLILLVNIIINLI